MDAGRQPLKFNVNPAIHNPEAPQTNVEGEEKKKTDYLANCGMHFVYFGIFTRGLGLVSFMLFLPPYGKYKI